MTTVSKKVGWEIAKKSLLPLITLLLLIAGYVYYKIRIAPVISEELYQDIAKYAGSTFIIFAGLAAQRITGAILLWYKETIAANTTSGLDDKLVQIMSRSSRVVIWTIALLVILPLYGVNINALIAALGVGSLAIALAAQDTIANVIAGFLIMVDTPFRIGDKIKLPSGEIAKVLDIGVRRSRFLSEDKAIIIVPNLDLSKSKIVNYTYGEERS